MRGTLIVFEGTDGSGKATQAGLLLRSLEVRGVSCREIDFPRYGNPFAEPRISTFTERWEERPET